MFEWMLSYGPHLGKICLLVIKRVRHKKVYSATETSLKIEISLVACLDMIISKQRNNKVIDQSAQMGRLVCAFVVH